MNQHYIAEEIYASEEVLNLPSALEDYKFIYKGVHFSVDCDTRKISGYAIPTDLGFDALFGSLPTITLKGTV